MGLKVNLKALDKYFNFELQTISRYLASNVVCSIAALILEGIDSESIAAISKEIKLPVQGGMDPKILLTDKDNLKKETIKYLDIFKDHPYIFNLGHGVLPETDPNMMDYLVKMVKDY